MNLADRLNYDKNDLFIVDAYTAEYYLEEKIDVLSKSIDYLLDNFRGLEILFTIFSNNGVLTSDIHRNNVILNTQKIILIDPDWFWLYKKKDIIIKNKKNLLQLFKDICMYSSTDDPSFEIKMFVNQLLDFKVDEKTDITYEFSRKLKGYKRPIDYLSKK